AHRDLGRPFLALVVRKVHVGRDVAVVVSGEQHAAFAERAATGEARPRDLTEGIRAGLVLDLVSQRADRRDVLGREMIEDAEIVRHGRRGYRSRVDGSSHWSTVRASISTTG